MALRFTIPVCVGDVRPAAGLVVPPLMRKPTEVEFRRGEDMTSVVAEMLGCVSVKVNAAVGAGKSTLLPKELALASRSLVFHVVPNPILAFDLYTYVVKCANESGGYPAVELFRSYEQEFPRIGVLFMSCSQFVGLLIKERSLSAYKDCVVFLDEAHESDAYTHVVRNLSIPMGAGVLVQASATFCANGFRPRESAGSVVETTYRPEDIMEKWDPADFSKPWGFAQVDNNILVYTDSRAQYNALAAAYEPAGFLVYRLEAGMSESLYSQAKADLVNPRGPLVMLVADSTFRSGFSFMAGTIMDSGRVSYFDPTPGKLLKKSRAIFKFEAEQTAGRGGRFSGMKSVYCRPEMELQPVICELEGVEMEAAAYLYRVLGFKPVRELSGTVMSRYDLPANVSFPNAINGVQPLSYYIVEGTGNVRAGALTAVDDQGDVHASVGVESCEELFSSGEDVFDAGSSVDSGSPESSASSVASSGGEGLGAGGEFRCRPVSGDVEMGGLEKELWASLFGLADGGPGLKMPLGGLYLVRGLGANSGALSGIFPRGLDSVMVMLGPGSRITADALSTYDRQVAMHLVLDRYNVCAVEVMAGAKALQDTAVQVVAACKHPAAREYFSRVVEAIASYDLEMRSLFSVLEALIFSVTMLEALEGVGEFVARRAAQYQEEFELTFNHSGCEGSSVALRLHESLKGIPVCKNSFRLAYDDPKKRAQFLDDNKTRGRAGKVKCSSFENSSSGVSDSDVVLSSDQSGVVVRPPRWMGVKDVTYGVSGTGEVSSVVLRPGKMFRLFGAKRVYEC